MRSGIHGMKWWNVSEMIVIPVDHHVGAGAGVVRIRGHADRLREGFRA